jgi:hypothetical protein
MPQKTTKTGLKKTARKSAPKKTATKRTPKKGAAKKTARKWSGRVTRTSNALDLESSIFRSKDPKRIARSLRRSAEKSKRKKGTPFQSAMSMLNFYINRAGRHLNAAEKKPLEKAKEELRTLFKKPESK